jgi:hypothetical protein
LSIDAGALYECDDDDYDGDDIYYVTDDDKSY